MKNTSKYISKKVIFVNPPELVRERVFEDLTAQNIEVYTLTDHNKIRAVYGKYPETLFFINIDLVMGVADWEFFIMSLGDSLPDIKLGVITFNRGNDIGLVQTFTGSLNISCGFIETRLGAAELGRQIKKVLKTHGVEGKSKIIRFSDSEGSRNRINFPMDGLYISGSIRDLGTSGFTCALDNPVPFIDRQLISHMQIRLNGMVIFSDCYFAARKSVNSEIIYIFAFHPDSRRMNAPRIQRYIHSSLQSEFNREFSLSAAGTGTSAAG